MKMDPEEQRLYSRYSTQVVVAAEVQQAPAREDLHGSSLECRARDISMTGLALYTQIELPVETVLRLMLEFGSPKREYVLTGKVMWSALEPSVEQYRTGIHLTGLPDDTTAWKNAVLQTLIT